MKLLPHWAVPDNKPGFYDSESATAIEQTAKVYRAMQELIGEYNQFVDELNSEFKSFLQQGTENHTVFEMKIEQLYHDFVKTITLKYQAQDQVLNNAVNTIIAEIPQHLETSLDNMYKNGEFDQIVYNSIANLKKDFDSITNNMNVFQSNINKSFSNLVTDIETFKQNTTTDFETLETELTEKIDNLVVESGTADMQKAIYDTNDNGIVDDAERLGGQLPEYYAKQQSLDTTNANIETLNISVNSTIRQIETVQNTANTAKTTADTALTTANNANNAVKNKLGVTETAVDSSKLGGQPASYYAPVENAINEYTHAKTGVAHYINGSGNNIKFVATADYVEGDLFYVNGVEVTACFQNGEPLTTDYFKNGYVVSCFLNGTKLNFKSGGTGNNLNFDVVGGTTQPVSPKENTIWVNTEVPISGYHFTNISKPNWASTPGMVNIFFESGLGGYKNSFNILKENQFFINPINATQNDGTTTWYDKKIRIYTNNQWYDVGLTIYLNGTFFNGYTFECYGKNGSATVTEQASNIRIALSSGANAYCHIIQPIDVTDYNYAILKFTSSYAYSEPANNDYNIGASLYIGTGPKNIDWSEPHHTIKEFAAGGVYELKVDLSSMTGDRYFTPMFKHNGSGTFDINILSMELI